MNEVVTTGKLVIFSAPSGAGKTTIVQHLLKVYPQLQFSVSACSRPMRKDEKEGVDYYFLSVDEFKNKIEKDEFVEWEEVYKDNFYGTLRSEIFKIWKTNHVAIFDLDVEGGLNLKKQFADKALAVFIMPPSVKHLEERLKQRETETPDSILRRIGKAEKELKTSHQFDRIILNDDLPKALKEADLIIKNFLET